MGVSRAAGVELITLRRSEAFRKVLPSKMFEAMAMGCPIVLAVEGEARALLEEAGAGIGITPESPQELAAAVVRLAEDKQIREQFSRRGVAYVRKHHDRSKLAMRYLTLLETAILHAAQTSCEIKALTISEAARQR